MKKLRLMSPPRRHLRNNKRDFTLFFGVLECIPVREVERESLLRRKEGYAEWPDLVFGGKPHAQRWMYPRKAS